MGEAASLTVKERLLQMASRRSGQDVSHIDRDASLKDLGVDSLGLAEMLFDIDDAFGIEITDQHIASLQTVGDLIDLVEREIAARQAA